MLARPGRPRQPLFAEGLFDATVIPDGHRFKELVLESVEFVRQPVGVEVDEPQHVSDQFVVHRARRLGERTGVHDALLVKPHGKEYADGGVGHGGRSLAAACRRRSKPTLNACTP